MLDSVERQATQLPETGMDGIGYVNLIDATWQPDPEHTPDPEDERVKLDG